MDVLRGLTSSGPAVEARPVPAQAIALLAIGSFAILLIHGHQLLADPDSHWHGYFGRQILATGEFPTVDRHSHSFNGAPWIAKEWLAQVILGIAHQLGGWYGVVVLGAASGAAAFTLTGHALLRRLDPVVAVVPLGLAFLLMLPHAVARPHLVAAPVMVAWFVILLEAAENGRAPPLAAALVMTLWANLHGSFLFGLAFGALFVVEAVLRASDRRRVLIGWSAFLAAAGLAALIHPYGVEHVVAARKVLDLGPAKAVIMEWRPADFSRFNFIELFLVAALGAGLLLGLRIPFSRFVMVVALVHMALSHHRHVLLLGLVGSLLIAPALAGLNRAGPAGAPRNRRAAVAGLALAVAGGGALVLAGHLAGWTYEPNPRFKPTAAVAAARKAGAQGCVINDYGFGGYLIANNIPTLIDGRTELYGGPFTARVVAALNLRDLDALDEILADRRAGWTLIETGASLVAYLDRKPGWRRVYGDDVAVVHLRVGHTAPTRSDPACRPQASPAP
jgi:hypothetical protein